MGSVLLPPAPVPPPSRLVDLPPSARYHVVQTVDDVFLVMELAAGCDLAELLMRNQRLTESQVRLSVRMGAKYFFRLCGGRGGGHTLPRGLWPSG